MQETIIVIPCYNEENRLQIDEFKSYFKLNPEVCFLFINDGSKDNTAQILLELENEFSNVKLLDKQYNSGKADSINVAFNYCFETYNSKYIGYFDADLATPLYEINRFLEIFNKYPQLQLVVGSRTRRMGARIVRNWKRHIIGRIFATFASSTLLLPFYDTQCGAKIFKTEQAKQIFNEKFISKWLFDVELIARLSLKLKYPQILNCIYEHPLENWYEKGESKIKFTDFIKLPIDLLKIYRKYHNSLKNNKNKYYSEINNKSKKR